MNHDLRRAKLDEMFAKNFRDLWTWLCIINHSISIQFGANSNEITLIRTER